MGGILIGVAIGLAIGWTWGSPQWWTNLVAKIKSGG